VHCERARVDDPIGPLAQPGQRLAFAADSRRRPARLAERVGPARLAEAAYQHLVGGLEEDDLDVVAGAPDLVEDPRIVGQEAALAEIDAERHAIDGLARVLAKLEEALDEDDGKVVDAVKAEILEDVDGGALSRAREAAHDHDLERVHAAPRQGPATDGARCQR
jgi:hypothetical protein